METVFKIICFCFKVVFIACCFGILYDTNSEETQLIDSITFVIFVWIFLLFLLKSVDGNKIIHQKYRENGKLLEYIQQQYIICLSGAKKF